MGFGTHEFQNFRGSVIIFAWVSFRSHEPRNSQGSVSGGSELQGVSGAGGKFQSFRELQKFQYFGFSGIRISEGCRSHGFQNCRGSVPRVLLIPDGFRNHEFQNLRGVTPRSFRVSGCFWSGGQFQNF